MSPKTLREEIDTICVAEGGYPEKWLRHEACPACGWVGGLHAEFSKYGLNHDVCGRCKFVCVNPYPPDDVLQRLYGGDYYTLSRELFELPRMLKGGAFTTLSAPRETLDELITLAVRDAASSGRWLDVGGGLGAFGSLVKSRLPGWDVALNEYNQASNKIARENFGLRIASTDPRHLQSNEAPFDVISAIAVLEHIADPLSFVVDYARLLRPGGRLVVLVPNFTDMCRRVARGSSPIVVPPYHLSLFNRENLIGLLERSEGFSSIETREDGAAAFDLINLAPYGDYWDITMPEKDKPASSITTAEYPLDLAVLLNALGEATKKAGSYFADHDGKVFLSAVATVKE